MTEDRREELDEAQAKHGAMMIQALISPDTEPLAESEATWRGMSDRDREILRKTYEAVIIDGGR